MFRGLENVLGSIGHPTQGVGRVSRPGVDRNKGIQARIETYGALPCRRLHLAAVFVRCAGPIMQHGRQWVLAIAAPLGAVSIIGPVYRTQELAKAPACERPQYVIFLSCKIRREPVPDTLGYRKRIGIVVPSTNTTVQPECEPMRPRGVTNHVGRSTIKERPLNTEQAFFEHMQ